MLSTVSRALWFACLCALLVVPRAGAHERALTADFDGDGRGDHVTFTSHEPSVVRVWLSTTKTTNVIRSSEPLRSVAAADLDGDHRAELVATNRSTGLHVWTRGRSRFRAFRQGDTRPPAGFSGSRHRASDGAPQAPAATDASQRLAPVLVFAPHRGPPARRAWNPGPRLAHDLTPSPSLTPFSPRPPPTSAL
jgi:hypothetical protein